MYILALFYYFLSIGNIIIQWFYWLTYKLNFEILVFRAGQFFSDWKFLVLGAGQIFSVFKIFGPWGRVKKRPGIQGPIRYNCRNVLYQFYLSNLITRYTVHFDIPCIFRSPPPPCTVYRSFTVLLYQGLSGTPSIYSITICC